MLSHKDLVRRIDAKLSRHGDLGARLVKGVLGIAGVRIFHAGVGFVTTALLARMLAPEGYGVYSYAMALVMFLTIPSELGIPGVAVREIAVTSVRRDWGHMMGFIVRAHQAIAILAGVLMGGGYLFLIAMGEQLPPGKRNCIALAFVLIPLVSFGSLRTAMLRGLRKVLLGELPEEVVRPLIFLALILMLTAFGRQFMSPFSVMALQVVATFAAFWSGLHLFFKNRPVELPGTEPHYKTSIWLKSSIPFALTAGLQLINGRTDILMLGFFRADSDVGVYRVATQMAALVVFGLRVVNSIQGPHIAHLYAEGDMKRLQTMVTKSSQAIMLATLPVVLVIFLFGQFIIRTVFGSEYARRIHSTRILLCSASSSMRRPAPWLRS